MNYFECAKPLYKKAKKYMYVRYFFLFIALISLILSVITTGKFLYISTLTSLLTLIIAWFMHGRSKVKTTYANEFHKQGLLDNAYEITDNSFKASHLLPKADSQAINKENPSNTEKTPLVNMIHENSYWNHHQYNELYKIYIWLIFLVLFIICIIGAYSIPYIKFDSDYLIPRLAFTVLSFSILFEIIENTMRLSYSAQQMLEIDNEISRSNEMSEYKIIDLYNSYISVKESTPSIPNYLYKKNKEKLNKGWSIRNIKH